MTGIHQRTAPTKINRADWNDLVTFLGGTSSDPQIDATKILLAQGGSLLSTWRYASDLTRVDAAKVAGNIAAAQMQTNVLAAIIAAGGIVDADVAAAAAIAKSKISTSGTWPLADLPTVPQCRAYRTTDQTIGHAGTGTRISFDAELYDTDTMHDLSTNPTRLTATTAGLYAISGNAVFQEHATGERILRILANDVTNIDVSCVPVNSASAWTILNVGTQYRLTAGQYVELVAYQSSGGDLAIRYVAGYSPHLAMTRLSS